MVFIQITLLQWDFWWNKIIYNICIYYSRMAGHARQNMVIFDTFIMRSLRYKIRHSEHYKRNSSIEESNKQQQILRSVDKRGLVLWLANVNSFNIKMGECMWTFISLIMNSCYMTCINNLCYIMWRRKIVFAEPMELWNLHFRECCKDKEVGRG